MSSILKKLALKSYNNYMVLSQRKFQTITKTYQRTLEKRPYLMQAIQAGILMGAGDLCAQKFFSQTETVDIDYIRTAKFCSIGFVFAGPCCRFWYGMIDKMVKVKSPFAKTVIKVAMDQLLFAPIFLATLISTISYMQEQSIQSIEYKLKTQYTDILTSNYYVWPWVQIVNFRFVPLNYQVLVTQTVAFLWNIYISWKTYSSYTKTSP
ncbi:Protein Mpv17 [Pseudolycoriella hygida]|uniref:Mitochondrial inner membrane protein Mpv17 n=1 Tax=Pseudolycoriella hygida TaxID=35572 RepID=A0A9Q0MMR2_9DIPT|nr:Protein Mpv17 [Pseudolycoriella hygida]KAJ6634475.1 Protein Mpv17 [Pseudolycoriella hygida]